jgi:hypothetical protein
VTILLNPACGACDCTGGSTVFASGSFTFVNGVFRAGSFRINGGGSVSDFQANIGDHDFTILKMVYDQPNELLYICGEFSEINGTAVRGIARVNATSGDLDTSWNPNPNSDVFDLVLVSGVVYFVGDFTTVGGVARNRAAAVDTSGSLQAWDPNLNDVGLSIAAGGGAIYVGGSFTQCGATTRHGIAKFNAAGTLQAWDPDLYAGDLGSPPGSFPAEADAIMVASNGLVYVGGYFSHVGGAAGTVRHWAACLDPNTATATAWDAGLDDIVFRFAEDLWTGSILMTGDFKTVHGVTRNHAAFVNTSGFAIAPDFGFGASGFGRYCMFDGDGSSETGNMYFGGRFTDLSGTVRSYLVKFDPDGVRQTAWEPELDAEVWSIAEVI